MPATAKKKQKSPTKKAKRLLRAIQKGDPKMRPTFVSELERMREKHGGAIRPDVLAKLDKKRERQARIASGELARRRTSPEVDVAKMRGKIRKLCDAIAREPSEQKARQLAAKVRQVRDTYGAALGPELLREIETCIALRKETKRHSAPDEPIQDTGAPVTESPDYTTLPDDPTSYDYVPDGAVPADIQAILDRMMDIEALLGTGKAGKQIIKNVIKDAKFIGEQIKAGKKSVVAQDGSYVATGKAKFKPKIAEEGAFAAWGKSKLKPKIVGDNSMAAFGRSKLKPKIIGPGASGVFGGQSLNEPSEYLPEGYLTEDFYDPFAPDYVHDFAANQGLFPEEFYDPYSDPLGYGYADPYGTGGEGAYAPVMDQMPSGYDVDPYWYGDTGYQTYDEGVFWDEPLTYTELPETGYSIPEYSVPSYDAPLFEMPTSWGGSFQALPLELEDLLAFDEGWIDDEDVDLYASSPYESDLDLFAPNIYADEIDYGVGPSIDSVSPLSELDALEGLELLREQFDDLGDLIDRRVGPGVHALEQRARATRNPNLLAKAAMARHVLRAAQDAHAEGLSCCEAVQRQGLEGFGSMVSGLMKKMGSLAGVATFGTLLGGGIAGAKAVSGGVSSIGENVTTGLKWGFGLAVPVVLAVWAARKLKRR